MEKLAVFKIIDDRLELCGYFSSKETATQYLTEIKKMIDNEFQSQLAGEYIAIPILYYTLSVGGASVK
jgi:hypothetical protein